MTTPRTPLSEHIVLDLPPARVSRLWSTLRGRLQPAPPPPRQRWAAAGGLLLAVIVLLAVGARFVFSPPAPPSSWAQLRSEAGTASLRLQDGSTVTLEPHTLLSIREQSEQRVELALEAGRVSCDVPHRGERVFSVSVAAHEVRVLAARFTVELSRERNQLGIEAQSGQVEVRRAGATSAAALLAAGQRWSAAPQSPSEPAKGADAAGNDSHPADLATAVPDAATAFTATTSTVPAGSAPSSTRPDSSPSGPVLEQAASLVLERGNAARRRGDLVAAAQDYEQLLREHPEDGRAGLAAFELGRLRMDEFHDVPAAIQALQLSVRAARETGLREDAMARLVRAHEILKDAPSCRVAREQYLEAYPKGIHAPAVLRACAGI